MGSQSSIIISNHVINEYDKNQMGLAHTCEDWDKRLNEVISRNEKMISRKVKGGMKKQKEIDIYKPYKIIIKHTHTQCKTMKQEK